MSLNGRKTEECALDKGKTAWYNILMKIYYDAAMLEAIKENEGKKLLLHSCCAPCSSYCLTQLLSLHTTVFYYNPNLDCEAEYEKRKSEQIRLLKETGLADFLDCDYSPEEYLSAVKGLENEKEGGARCTVCFSLRLERTAKEAKERGYDLFGTTLTVSPHKDADRINAIGYSLQEKWGVTYLPSDFKKRDGYLTSIRLSKQYGLYRQNYCGCAFSKREEEPEP